MGCGWVCTLCERGYHSYSKMGFFFSVLPLNASVLLYFPGEKYEIVTETVEEDSQGVITPTGKTCVYEAKYVAVATGHHAKPSYPSFPGLETFKGDTLFSAVNAMVPAAMYCFH